MSMSPELGDMLMLHWHAGERLAQRAIEDKGFIALDAKILFRQNCPNIDLVVFGKGECKYVQVKSTIKAAGRNCVVVDGSAWTHDQLFENSPVYNKHDSFRAHFVLLVDQQDAGDTRFYVAPPGELEVLVKQRGREWAAKPKRDGTPRSIAFRKELPRVALEPWREAWHLLGLPLSDTPHQNFQ